MKRLGVAALLLGGLLAPVRGRAAMVPSAALQAAQDQFSAGRYDEVIGRLEGEGLRRVRRRERPRAYELLGRSYEARGEIAKALSLYQVAEGIYPRDINLLSLLADLLRGIQLDDRARPFYERVLKIHPNNAAGNLGLAEISRRQGFLARAAAHYERALAEWDQNPAIWRDYAEVLSERGDYAAAIAAIRKSLALAAEVDSVVDLGLFERASGRPAEAVSLLQKALRLKPERTDIRLRLGLWSLENGDLPGAQEQAAAILAGAPEDPSALWLRAAAAMRSGRREAARADLARAAQGGRAQPFAARWAAAALERLR